MIVIIWSLGQPAAWWSPNNIVVFSNNTNKDIYLFYLLFLKSVSTQTTFMLSSSVNTIVGTNTLPIMYICLPHQFYNKRKKYSWNQLISNNDIFCLSNGFHFWFPITYRFLIDSFISRMVETPNDHLEIPYDVKLHF